MLARKRSKQNICDSTMFTAAKSKKKEAAGAAMLPGRVDMASVEAKAVMASHRRRGVGGDGENSRINRQMSRPPSKMCGVNAGRKYKLVYSENENAMRESPFCGGCACC